MKSEIINVDEISEIIIAFANGELHRRLDVSDSLDDRDTIISGINMLGEELEKTTISRDYFMNIYNSVSEILIFTDLKGKIIDLNYASECVFNKTLTELKHFNLKELISTRFKHLHKLFEEPNLDLFNSPFESALMIDNLELPISVTLSKVVDRFNSHKGYIFIARDITEIKDKEINDLKNTISIQEKERRRLANDLHDSLGQEMNAIKLYMNSLAVMDTSSEIFKETFETCKTIVDNSIETVRNISFDLMPKALESGGLVQALNELVKKLRLVCEIEYNFPDIDLTLEKESQIHVYRVVQEFINNSIKHNKACEIEMHLSQTQNNLKLLIKDNGKGFIMGMHTSGNGIFNMKARLKALNAKYIFESEMNKGTSIELFIIENQ